MLPPIGDARPGYLPRYIDSIMSDMLGELPAIAIDGPKSVGKTETAKGHVDTVLRLDSADVRSALDLNLTGMLQQAPRVCVDEWQYYPPVWNGVRRLIDDKTDTTFVLTGSATPRAAVDTHSGAGRIVSTRMRPLSLSERASSRPTIFLKDLLSGQADITGTTDCNIDDYAQEICGSGFPHVTTLSPRARTMALEGYVRATIDRDILELGHGVRQPGLLRGWMSAYASCTSTTTSYTKMLDAVTPGESDKPSANTMRVYRELLQRLWIIDPVPSWTPTMTPLARMTGAPKHQLCDPGLAAHLMGITPKKLTSGAPGTAELAGALFEALATLTVRAAAEVEMARVSHLRTRNGDKEIDLIVERFDGSVLAIEVKLARTIEDHHVSHLHWLNKIMGDRLIDRIIINAGSYAYRRRDGIAVIPLEMLG